VLDATGYPGERLHFVTGPVEETIPATTPEALALLRLDTDWYESTRHELDHLYPLLVEGGVLIIDDYGEWEGARQAVDEYFMDRDAPLLSRVDHTGRIGVKP
jgi:O-methyltransferase